MGCQGLATHQRGPVPLCDPCEEAASSLTRLPLGPVSEAAGLVHLAQLRTQAEALDAMLSAAVERAVQAGHSYVVIGQALGVTRQAARQRHLRGRT